MTHQNRFKSSFADCVSPCGWMMDQRGSLLIGLIVTMVVFGLLVGAMVYIFGTSSLIAAFGNQPQQAYYTAESGARYAIAEYRHTTPQMTADQFSAAFSNRTITLPNNTGKAVVTITNSMPGITAAPSTTAAETKTLILGGTLVVNNATGFPDNNGFFRMPSYPFILFRFKRKQGNTLQIVTGFGSATVSVTAGSSVITAPINQVSIVSKGYYPATNLTSRTVEYGWILSGSGGSTPLDPVETDPQDLVDNNPFGPGTSLGKWEVTTAPDGTTNTIHAKQITGGNAEAVLGYSGGETNPFYIAWSNAGNFLSYDAQVKIAVDPADDGYVTGLTFRSKGVNPGQWTQYGLSFSRYDQSIFSTMYPTLPTGLCPDWIETGNYVQNSKVAYPAGGNVYYICKESSCPIIYKHGKALPPSFDSNWLFWPRMFLLWVRDANNQDHWLAYQMLTNEPSTGIVDANGNLKNWSTILLRVVEGAALKFSSGATGFQVGDIVSGASSGATGKVFKKIQTTGAQDVLILNNITGAFTTGENISSPNQTTGLANIEYRPRDNYIWAFYGDTAIQGSGANNTPLDTNRAAAAKGAVIDYPPAGVGSWNSASDFFTLAVWNPSHLNTTKDSTILILGTGKEAGAILRTSIWTTGGYTSDNFPYEMGWHTLGDAATSTYFTDLGINFTGQSSSGSPYLPPIQQ